MSPPSATDGVETGRTRGLCRTQWRAASGVGPDIDVDPSEVQRRRLRVERELVGLAARPHAVGIEVGGRAVAHDLQATDAL